MIIKVDKINQSNLFSNILKAAEFIFFVELFTPCKTLFYREIPPPNSLRCVKQILPPRTISLNCALSKIF